MTSNVDKLLGRSFAILAFVAWGVASAPISAEQGPAVAPTSPQEGNFEEVDLSRFFVGMEGTFVLVDAQQGLTRVYNPARAEQRFLPASTFKIANSLVVLETAVVDGPDFALPWDPRATPPQGWWPESWQRDQSLRTAFQNSVYWFYQELARRVGEDRMGTYLQQFRYGNQDLGGGLDRFWLHGDLRISPFEQVAFLQRFYFGDLGVSERTGRIVQDVMVLEDHPHYRLSGKTGTADVTPTKELGWLVGFLERGEAVYFFALNMEGERVWEDWPPHQRKELVRRLLTELGVIAPPAG